MSISRIFRVLLSFFLLLVGLAIVVPIAAYFFFDPNHFKNEITTYINSKSGLPLEIHGKISMQVFPWVGLKVHQVDLAHPSSFGHGKMIEIQEMGLKMPLNELLQKHLQIESLDVKGLTINAIKNKDGSTNWEYYSKQVKNKQNATPSTSVPTKSDTPSQGSKKLRFDLLKFSLNDVKATFEDRQSGEKIEIEKLQLVGRQGSAAGSYPIEGEISVRTNDLTSQGKFEGTFEEVNNKWLASLQTDFTFDIPKNPASFRKGSISTQINANFAESIAFNKLMVKSGQLELKGHCKVPFDQKQAITFHADINKLDLNGLSGSSKGEVKPAVTNDAANKVLVQHAVSKPKTSQQLVIGSVTIGKVLAHGLVLDNVSTQVKKDATTLTLRDLSANFYQGKLLTNVVKHLQNPQAPVALVGKLTQVSLSPLLKDLKQEARVSGVSNVDFNLSYHETPGLNGTLKLQISDGVIEGVDVKYYLSLAQSLLKKTETKETDTKRTPFGTLVATMLFNNNVMDNNDLAITSADFTAKGEGSINLNSQTIAYKLQALKVYQDNKEHTKAYPLAIRIKGPLGHPKVEPDYDVYLKKLMEQEVKGELNKQIGKLLGAPKETDPNAPSDAPQNLEDAAKKKLEEKLNKGLKKLFKQ
jgi:uncharacterized protein involved in outer membrane biogenesis